MNRKKEENEVDFFCGSWLSKLTIGINKNLSTKTILYNIYPTICSKY
ncbi:MAG: hypothetical protein AAGJ08_17980 [Cyanobacteria bacterium P01_H01_bin.35]